MCYLLQEPSIHYYTFQSEENGTDSINCMVYCYVLLVENSKKNNITLHTTVKLMSEALQQDYSVVGFNILTNKFGQK